MLTDRLTEATSLTLLSSCRAWSGLSPAGAETEADLSAGAWPVWPPGGRDRGSLALSLALSLASLNTDLSLVSPDCNMVTEVTEVTGGHAAGVLPIYNSVSLYTQTQSQ